MIVYRRYLYYKFIKKSICVNVYYLIITLVEWCVSLVYKIMYKHRIISNLSLMQVGFLYKTITNIIS